MKRLNKIAVQLQSEVQLFSLEPLIREMLKKYSCVDIIVDGFDGDQRGFDDIARGLERMLFEKKLKYRKINDLQKYTYDVALLPYMDKRIKSRYYLKYEYGTLNIKPNLTYLPNLLDGFHGFLCQSTVTYELLKAYGATFPVENLRFHEKSKVVLGDNGKKRLLFAPTYNDQDEVEELVKIVEILKEEYYLIIKGHHGTNYLKDNIEKKQVFSELADEYYDSTMNLSDLITKVDVCLFGNSSAIGEALYAGIPCAIYARNLDYFGLDGIHTTQYWMAKEGILPWASKEDELISVIKKAMSTKYRDRQRDLSDRLFPKEYKTGVDGYMRVIDFFLENRIAEDYALLHDYVLQQKEKTIFEIKEEAKKEHERNISLKNEKELLETKNESLKKENNKLRSENSIVEEKIKIMEEIIEDNKKKKLYKLSDKIYKIEGKILHVKS